MANLDQPCGAKPYGEVIRIRKYVAGAACYPGDFVHLEDDGKVDPAVASENILGVAMSYASGDTKEVLVCDDPQQLYVIQSDGSDIDAQTDIGLNYNITATAGDTTFKISRMELDSDTGATSSILPLKLLGVEARVGNALGAAVDCLVKINNHVLGNVVVGL